MFTVISVLSCALLLTACSSNNSQQSGVAENSVKPSSASSENVFSSSEEVSDVGNPFDTSSENVSSSLPSEELSDAGNPFEIPSDDVSSSLSSEEISSDTSEVGEILTYKDFEYQKGNDEDNGVTITKYTGSDANVSIPEKIDGTDVTILGDSAFAENKSIKSVTIPKTVVIIDNDTFADCLNLQNVTFEKNSSLRSIYANSFYNTAITQFTVPESCTGIGKDSFMLCKNLKDFYVLGNTTKFSKNFVLTINVTVHAYRNSQAAKQLSPLHGYKFEALDDVSE